MDEREQSADGALDGAPGALYRALPREEPPARLDAAVLAAARANVAPKRERRWAAPVALAAVLVLSVGISLRVADERPDAQFKVEAPAATPPATPPAPATVAQSAPPSEKVEVSPSAKVEKPQPQPQSMPQRARPVARPSPPPGPATQQAPQAEASVRQELAKNVAPAEERAAAPSSPPAPPRVEPPPPIAFVPSPRADSAQQRSQESAPPAAAGAALAERPAAREMRMGKSAMADSSLASAAAQSPETWLERIVQLRAQGRDKEADESYAAFRRRYPSFVIAPDLLPKVAPAEMRSR